MTRYVLLPLALLGLLLLTPGCRHSHSSGGTTPGGDSHEEALPVSSLPHAEFSTVTPSARSHGRRR